MLLIALTKASLPAKKRILAVCVKLSPVYVYAVETAIQMTLTDLTASANE